MDLDRREEFAGDAFNPFGTSAGYQINTQLQAQNSYIAKHNTQGGQIIDQLPTKKQN